jgi:lipopolysaccharide/colanic/teichoic acid biosynthesis glycosyltransferase
VWLDSDCRVDPKARLIGNVWVGAGRSLPADTTIVGPAVVWDDPAVKPVTENVDWLNLEPTEAPPEETPVNVRARSALAKRIFDFTIALFAVLVTSPLYPIIMLLIWLEDGRPFFFTHKREGQHGREFGCMKFRSMRNDAEQLVAALKEKNVSDGNHVFIKDDPRVTKIGKILRKTNLDELPQFINVLLGQMSIVGPRPSPHRENQFAPGWREARLSVKPGITGLWQISRTRQAGSDFQEWIRYDLEYVEKQSLWLDIKIIFKTIDLIFRKGMK